MKRLHTAEWLKDNEKVVELMENSQNESLILKQI